VLQSMCLFLAVALLWSEETCDVKGTQYLYARSDPAHAQVSLSNDHEFEGVVRGPNGPSV
jgi:hypothetical protein